jgi:hypothetical protein
VLSRWLASVDDPDLAARMRAETFVAGGAIASLLQGEKVQDYDVYFRNETTCRAVGDYYAAKLALYPALPFDPHHPFAAAQPTEPIRPLAKTDNCIYLSNHMQVMTIFPGEPDWLVAQYDLVHCMGYFTARDQRLVVSAEARHAILTRTLRYRPGHFAPILSLLRLPKFFARGYTIDIGQLFTLVTEVASHGLGDRNKVRQLLGLLAEKDSRFSRALTVAEGLPEAPLDHAALSGNLSIIQMG